MSRSGYVEDDDDGEYPIQLYRGAVERAIRGKRGQAFLRDLADALDAMPVKKLVAEDLVRADGSVCAIGSVAVARIGRIVERRILAMRIDPPRADEPDAPKSDRCPNGHRIGRYDMSCDYDCEGK